MGNCLITKLKENIQNSNLRKLGEIRANVINRIQDKSNSSCIFGYNVNSTITAIGGYFVDSSDPNIKFDHVDIIAGQLKYVYAELNTEFGVVIPNKYDLNFIAAGSNWLFNIEDFKYCTELTRFSANSGAYGKFDATLWTKLQILTISSTTDMTGDISTLKNCPNLTRLLGAVNTKLEGNIEELLNLSHLNEIQLNGAGKITGDAMIFTDPNKFVGLSNGILYINQTAITNKTAETKALIESAHPGITVQL